MFNSLSKSITMRTKDDAETQRARIIEMREKRKRLLKRQRDHYTAQHKEKRRRKVKTEQHETANDLFKVQPLHASLVSAQSNASIFHAFTIPFWAMASKPAPMSLSLPKISPVLSACM